MKIFSSCALVFSLCALFASSSLAQDDHFDIVRFQIEGNTLLPHPPLPGANRACDDHQIALEVAEGGDRKPDYNTRQLYVPWQELISGVIENKSTYVPGPSQFARFKVSGLDSAPFNLASQIFTRN